MTKDKALKMAIEALEFIKDGGFYTGEDDCIEACKAALEQPAWQGLSDNEIRKIDDLTLGDYYVEQQATNFARDIEQALKEKNNG